MQKVAGVLFLVAWLLCGCTVDTFFDGGAPLFFVALFVVAICVAALDEFED